MNASSICQIFVFILIILCSYLSLVTSSANVTESQVITSNNSNNTSESMASAVQLDPAANEDSFNVNYLQFITIFSRDIDLT